MAEQADDRSRLDAALVTAMASCGAMAWGRDDCALWCADILKEALGYDAAARFRGRYKTKIGAHRVLGPGGLAKALRLAGRAHGWRRITGGHEAVGDIGIASIAGVSSTVICRAPGWFVGRNDAGWTALPTKAIRIMWSVVK